MIYSKKSKPALKGNTPVKVGLYSSLTGELTFNSYSDCLEHIKVICEEHDIQLTDDNFNQYLEVYTYSSDIEQQFESLSMLEILAESENY